MTGVSERLDAIEARLGAATPGPWRTWKHSDGQRGEAVETAWAHDSDGADTELITDWCTPPDAVFIAHAPQDITDLLVLARKQQAAIDAVRALADAWEARGEHDMKFSKSIPDEDIAIEILTNGAGMVENARHIRNALEGK